MTNHVKKNEVRVHEKHELILSYISMFNNITLNMSMYQCMVKMFILYMYAI